MLPVSPAPPPPRPLLPPPPPQLSFGDALLLELPWLLRGALRRLASARLAACWAGSYSFSKAAVSFLKAASASNVIRTQNEHTMAQAEDSSTTWWWAELGPFLSSNFFPNLSPFFFQEKQEKQEKQETFPKFGNLRLIIMRIRF